MNAVEIDALKLVEKSLEVNQPVRFSTPNIDIVGVRLQSSTPESGKPTPDVNLTFDGVGVRIPGVVTISLKQATVVSYSSLKDVLSEVSSNDTTDSVKSAGSTLAINSTVVSFNTHPKLNSSAVLEPFKIVLRNSQVRLYINNNILIIILHFTLDN